MKCVSNKFPVSLAALFWLVSLFGVHAQAQQAALLETQSSSSPVSAASDAADVIGVAMAPQSASPQPLSPAFFSRESWRHRSDDNAVVSIGSDATLLTGQQADVVVAIAGSASNAGEVADAVVSVLGNSHITGPVGGSAVAVLGNVYVNSTVDDDVVAIMGNVELGPQARVNSKVVAVMGQVTRDPGAVVRDGVQNVGAEVDFGGFDWLKSWIRNCFFYGRPLAFAPGLAWAWGLALGSLALYVLTALLFPHGVERCVQTLAKQPGRSVLTAFLSMLLTPLLFVMLVVTIIGILAIPLLGIALLVMESFGKLVMLAWIGRRLTQSFTKGWPAHSAFAVLVGGIIVTGLYLVPVLGLVLYKLLGVLGFGVVTYTLILVMQTRRIAEQPMVSAASTATHANASDASDDDGQRLEPATSQIPEQGAPHSSYRATAPIAAAPALEYPRADFGLRMGALLIDTLMAIIAFSWLPGSFLLALAVYGALMWKLKGTTIGGLVCNLQVVRMDGCELDWATVIVRALSCFLSLFVAGLGFIWIVFDAEKQAWHDKLAGTVVVRVPKGVSLV